MKKIWKTIFVSFVVLSVAASVFAEVVTCPHCGKDFDTASVTAKKTQVDGSEYEIITIKRYEAMKKNYEGKKVCFKGVKIYGPDNGDVYFKDSNWNSATGKYDDSIVEQIIDLTDSDKYVNVYGIVENNGWGWYYIRIDAIR